MLLSYSALVSSAIWSIATCKTLTTLLILASGTVGAVEIFLYAEDRVCS
jgi:hypothetical protein